MNKYMSRKAIFIGVTLFIDILWLCGIASLQTAGIASFYGLIYNLMEERDD